MEERQQGGPHEPHRHVWAPPEPPPGAGGWAGWDAGGPGGDAPDGPPPPPWERDRRRRRLVTWIVLAVVLLIAVPVGLAIAGAIGGDGEPAGEEAGGGPSPTTPPAPDEQPTEAPPGPGDGPAPDPDAELDPPDPAALDGADADFASLLARIEDSERVMLRFQRELQGTFLDGPGGPGGLGGPPDLEALYAAIAEVADEHATALDVARDELEEPLDTAAAEDVRSIYLEHLEAWSAFMGAVAEDPTLLGPDGDSSRYDLDINRTAVDFAEALEDQLPADADAEVRRFAQDLLDRGFRFDGDAQV